jgi:N-acetylmuramoyl-L-alanine amidase
MMEIKSHKLVDAVQRETPNRGGIIEPRYLVFHSTAGGSAQGAIEWLCNPDAKASAHIVIARDGTITQLAPFNVKTWHAGASHWAGLTGLNEYSIGIEMDNAGKLFQVGPAFRSAFGKEYPEDQALQARHKNESDMAFWHVYTEEQITVGWNLAGLLVRTYGLLDIVGHDDIAPGRKNDPGPAFPLANIKAKVFGRSEEGEEIYEVVADSLNIRRGPGIEYEPVAPPLLRGTRVALLDRTDRWSRVDVEGPDDTEGWVSSKYIRKA